MYDIFKAHNWTLKTFCIGFCIYTTTFIWIYAKKPNKKKKTSPTARQPDLTYIKLLESNKKDSQPSLVRAEVHLAQHPTRFSTNLIK